jgi:hypothetical protein
LIEEQPSWVVCTNNHLELREDHRYKGTSRKCLGNGTRKQTATEQFRMGARGNAKKGKTQREMDRWSKTEHDKPWTERRGY